MRWCSTGRADSADQSGSGVVPGDCESSRPPGGSGPGSDPDAVLGQVDALELFDIARDGIGEALDS
jgi:hypothetical protein